MREGQNLTGSKVCAAQLQWQGRYNTLSYALEKRLLRLERRQRENAVTILCDDDCIAE
jgi:hypothetical protein